MRKLNVGKELNLYECCSIYTMHIAATMFSGILSPEAADQCWLMLVGKEGGWYCRRSNYLKSDYIKDCIFNAKQTRTTINFPLNEITANPSSILRKELRYALAYDGAVYFLVDDTDPFWGSLELDVKYDKYTAVYNLGLISISFNWQLLSYIQDMGWLSKVHISYIPC